MSFKRYPLTPEQINALQSSSPDLYRDMVEKYGVENVTNNLLVDVQVLTESKPVLAKGGVSFTPDRNTIKLVCKASNSKFEKYIKNPINSLKGWVIDGEELGYSPVITNHTDTMENRHGFTVGSSYYTKEIDGKLCLFCKFLLISPQSKYHYIDGSWREVSPTIMDDYTISETSFVNIPAQETNTVLSSGQTPFIPSETETLSGISDITISDEKPINWSELIAQSRERAEKEEKEILEKHKQNKANFYVDKLVRNGIFTSGQKDKVIKKLVQLSSGANPEPIMFDLLQESKKHSLFMNKPRHVFLKATLDMNLTKDQRWQAFEKLHRSDFPNPTDLRTAFDKAEATTQVSLQSGEGQIEDPMAEMSAMCAKLSKMCEEGKLSDEHKASLSKAMGYEVKDCSLSDGKADGKPVESGGTDMPNNTALSANLEPTPEKDNHIKMLEKGYEAMQEECKKLREEMEENRKRHEHLKSILGGDK